MWNVPNTKRLNRIPTRQAGVPTLEKKAYLHLFMGGSDWYVLEYDKRDTFYGYAILNGDLQNAEFGYFSFSELKSLKVGFMEIDCEFAKYFKPQPLGEIDRLKHLRK